MAKGYNTGGKHEPGGIAKYEERAGSSCDVGRMGAGMGTGYDQPNTKDYHPLPGGKGSSGSKSTSTPSSK